MKEEEEKGGLKVVCSRLFVLKTTRKNGSKEEKMKGWGRTTWFLTIVSVQISFVLVFLMSRFTLIQNGSESISYAMHLNRLISRLSSTFSPSFIQSGSSLKKGSARLPRVGLERGSGLSQLVRVVVQGKREYKRARNE